MNKKLGIVLLIAFFIGNLGLLKADELLPSDAYYKDNIAVTEVQASSPTLRDPGDDDGPSPGPGNGEGQEGGTGQVNAPIGDALLPILSVGILYAFFLFYRSRTRKSEN